MNIKKVNKLHNVLSLSYFHFNYNSTACLQRFYIAKVEKPG